MGVKRGGGRVYCQERVTLGRRVGLCEVWRVEVIGFCIAVCGRILTNDEFCLVLSCFINFRSTSSRIVASLQL